MLYIQSIFAVLLIFSAKSLEFLEIGSVTVLCRVYSKI